MSSTPGSDAPIAICGVSCRLPGAPDVDAYWDLLREGRSGLARLTDEQLARVPRRWRDSPGYVPFAGLIDGQDLFDPAPFGLTDHEAALMDPQHRLMLQSAWHALEHAGHGGGRGAGAVGVFVGSMQSAYLANNLYDRWEPTGAGRDPMGSLQTAIATQPDYLPLQLAYRLNLTGPAIAVASSCSTSLVAVHLAAQSLTQGECDTALAGGVSLIVPQGMGYVHVPDGIFSADGVVRPFSRLGTGVVYTQGAVAVVLRRLADALADGDPVLAVLHGSAVNNDGAAKAGFTAPSVRGQARAVAEALDVAGAGPRDIGLLEAHGTGTPLGDPIELAALQTVFGSGPAWCGLGSVKGSIGHTNSAAGAASLVKAVLALQHQVLPASLHADPVNPHLGLEHSPFEVITRTRPWDTPVLAGVSSFGVGGTNCHVVLGPAPARAPSVPDPRPPLLVISAATPEAAAATAAAVAAAAPDLEGADLAHTLSAGRVPLPVRVAGVGGRLSGAPVVSASGPAPRTVLAFPGAGSQYPGMGATLARDEPVFAASLHATAERLLPLLGADVRDALRSDEGRDPCWEHDPARALPALYAVSLATARLLASWGVRPDVVLGHSVGECTAAVVAGALDEDQAAVLVAARCTAAAAAAGGGAMLAVALGEDELWARLADPTDPDAAALDLAAVNAPGSCVVSGPSSAVDAFAARLRTDAIAVTAVGIAAAMHSRLIEPELPRLAAALAGMRAAEPTVPLISTVTGTPVGAAELGDPDYWVRQLRGTVEFAAGLRTAVNGPSVLLQAGPGTALAVLARRHGLADLKATVTCLEAGADEHVTVRSAVGALWCQGAAADPAAVTGPGRRRVHAPGYAFTPTRYWIDPPQRTGDVDDHVGADEPLQLPVWEQSAPVPPAEETALPPVAWRVHGTGPLAEALRARVNGTEGPPAGHLVVHTGRGDDSAAVATAIRGFGAIAAELHEQDGDVALLLVTQDGTTVTGTEAPAVDAAALRVLPRVLGQERPGLRWGTVDLGNSGQTVAEQAATVLAEAGALLADDAAQGTETAHRERTRWRRRMTGWRPPSRAARPQGAVLITGGLGPVGLLFAGHLAARGHRVVVTTRGRQQGTHVPDGVEVRTVDAADVTATTALLDELAAQGPPALVVHAAGVVAGATLDPLRELDPHLLESHLAAKLGGALALHAAVEALPSWRRPQAVLLMSSATTLVGGLGMGAYTAANAAADAIASSLPGWSAVVWDGWSVGVDTVVGAASLDETTGLAALDRLLTAGPLPSAVAVSTTDLVPRIAAAGRQRGVATGSAEALSPHERLVADLWSELFGAPVTDREADFFALGGHSLLGTRMLQRLNERFGTDLRLRDLLAAPTVRAVAALLAAPAAPLPADPPTGATPSAPPVDPDGTFPMTRVQHAYWVGRDGGYAWGSVPCHFYLEYEGVGLQVPRLEDAWNDVIARHPMLRSVTTSQGRFQELSQVPRYRIRVADLRNVDAERREAKLEAVREQVAHRPGPSDRWPLVQLRAALLPEDRVRVFLGVDVLVCDAASWWVVEADLRARYLGHALPEPPVHPAVCTAALEARRHSAAGERAARYWRERLDTLPGPPALPVGTPADPPRFLRRAARLHASQWTALKASAAARSLTPTAVLLTAYADALRGWSPSDAGFCVTVTLFDRPDVHPDVDRVVGDFTSLLLHQVHDQPAQTFAARAAATQRQLFEDLDHREFTALEVAAEQAARTGERRPVPVVFTSALGLDSATAHLEWMGEQVAALSQTPQTWLDHQVLEHDGELRLQWDAPQGALPDDQLQATIDGHVAVLRSLAEDPGAWGEDTEDPGASSEDTGSPAPLRSAARRAAAPDPDPVDVVLPLRMGSGQDRPTLHLVHPSGGDVLCYAELSRLLDPRLDVVAITDPGLASPGSAAPDSVPELAQTYLAALAATGAGAPWLLGGWSMGGTLAQEMARQLHERGEHVAALIMLDSNDPTWIRPVPGSPQSSDPDPEEHALAVLLRHLHALEAYLGIDLDAGAVASAAPDKRARAAADRLRAHRLLGRNEDVADRMDVFARHLRILAAHTPSPLRSEQTASLLVRADRRSPRNSGIGMGIDDTPPDRSPDLGWGAHLAGPLEVIGVDTHHYGLLHPPALPAVAALINDALAAHYR